MSEQHDRKVFVGGLPATVDEAQLREDFMRFGNLDDIYIPTDKATGQMKGFAFITFSQQGDAHRAAGEMHARDYHGRKISVSIARPRQSSATRPVEDERSSGAAASTHQRVGPAAPLSSREPEPERERDHHTTEDDERDRFGPRYTHGNSSDGSGRYGARDPRPQQAWYD